MVAVAVVVAVDFARGFKCDCAKGRLRNHSVDSAIYVILNDAHKLFMNAHQ